MKKIVLLAALTVGLCSSFRSQAQFRINVQLGLPVVQQTWYDDDEDYYYMPEQDCYYNVRRRVYVYPEAGNWVYGSCLPARYGGATWSNARYYRIRERAPFNRNDYYRSQYRVANNYDGGNRGGWERRDNGRHNGWDRNNNGYNRVEQNGGYRREENSGSYNRNSGYQQQNNGNNSQIGRGRQPNNGMYNGMYNGGHNGNQQGGRGESNHFNRR